MLYCAAIDSQLCDHARSLDCRGCVGRWWMRIVGSFSTSAICAMRMLLLARLGRALHGRKKQLIFFSGSLLHCCILDNGIVNIQRRHAELL